LSVLVSFVAAAYVSAAGESYRRRWDADGDLPFIVSSKSYLRH
jgi:hypothetical protein